MQEQLQLTIPIEETGKTKFTQNIIKLLSKRIKGKGVKNSFQALLIGAHTQMLANLVPCFQITSTGSHEVLHHGQLTLLGCPVQGCISIIIRVKEVALHLGGKVLSNHKMAAHGTQEEGIASSLH